MKKFIYLFSCFISKVTYLDFHHVCSRHMYIPKCVLLGDINFYFCLSKVTPDLHLHEPQTEIDQNFQQRIVKATHTLPFHIPQTHKHFPSKLIFQYSRFAILQQITVLFTD